MTIRVVTPRVDDGTDGLASAYQLTQITGAGVAAVQDTSGAMLFVVTPFPSWQIVPASPSPTQEGSWEPREFPEPSLATRMARDKGFIQGTERGLAEIEQGRYSRIEDIKKKLGDL